jgi:hypothetical protein
MMRALRVGRSVNGWKRSFSTSEASSEPAQANAAAKMAFYGLGAGAGVVVAVKGTKAIGLHEVGLGPLEAALPLWLGGVGYYTLSNPEGALAMLPGPAQSAVLALEHARVHRPGSLIAGFGMAAISGVWLAITAKGYAVSF